MEEIFLCTNQRIFSCLIQPHVLIETLRCVELSGISTAWDCFGLWPDRKDRSGFGLRPSCSSKCCITIPLIINSTSTLQFSDLILHLLPAPQMCASGISWLLTDRSSSRKGLNAVGYCRSVRPTGAHWTGTHTLLEQEVGPQILKQCPQHWRNSLPLLPLSYSFPYTCMNRRSSQSNFDKIRKLQYFNLYSVVSDKDTGLRFLDNKVFVELLFMSHFANFLLERKKRGGWRDGIEVP